jgi:putative exosortase-associated protein (TIGR04073 family)
MIKKLLLAAIISFIVISSATLAFCEEPGAKLDGPTTKLGRGLANIVTFPLEIPEQISRTNNSDGPVAASTVGVLKGLGRGVIRACIGVFETATFFYPGAGHYGAILKDPEYFLESSNY